MQQDLNV